MKKSYFLTTVAVLAAAAVTVYAELPKDAPPLSPTDLPPVVTDPNATIPKPTTVPVSIPAPAPVPKPVPVPTPVSIPAPAPVPKPVPIPQPTPAPVSIPTPAPVPKPVPIPQPTPAPEAIPVPAPFPVPTPKSEPIPKLPVAAAPSAPMPQVVPASAPPMLPMVPPPVAAAPATPKLPPVAAAPAAPVLQPKLPTVPPPTTPTPPLTQVPPTVAPAPKTPVAVVPTAAPIAKQYVVLKDDKLIEGTVKIDGEKVIVKQGALDRPYAKGDIQFIGRSKDEVYRFVVGKVPPNDPAARLKVARWCMFNGMRTHALIEAREVLRLDPKNAAATQLARVLEESLVKFPEDGAPAASTAPNIPVSNPTGPSLPPVPPPIPPAANPPVAADEPEADIPQELAALFPTRIQPILVNQCADCHAKPGHASGFVLAKGTDFDPNPALAKPNLAAVLKQLHKADPAKSPLLVKSLTAHGGMQQPAFVNRNIPGYRILEAWTYAVSGTPTSPAPASEPAVKSNPLPPSATPPAAKAPVASATGSDKPSPLPPPDVGAFGQEAKPLPAGPDPANTGEPADEFDPSVYNRNAHPGRK